MANIMISIDGFVYQVIIYVTLFVNFFWIPTVIINIDRILWRSNYLFYMRSHMASWRDRIQVLGFNDKHLYQMNDLSELNLDRI